MAKTTEITVWVIVDENGEAVATIGTKDEVEGLDELYDENVNGGASIARRCIKVTLTVPLPEVVELTGVVPAEGNITLTLKVGK